MIVTTKNPEPEDDDTFPNWLFASCILFAVLFWPALATAIYLYVR